MSLKILDLFSGIGGMSLGFEAANFIDYDFSKMPGEQKSKSDMFFETIAFCEIEKATYPFLKANFGDKPIFEDVTKLRTSDLPDKIDIITGGFPCQDLSVAGKRAGFEGDRSILFNEILRLAKESNAKYILFENSAQLIRKTEYFTIFAQRLKEYGYRYEAFLLRASDFGYPHKRERAYVIAYADETNSGEPFKNFLDIKKQYKGDFTGDLARICASRYRRKKERDFSTERDFLLRDNGFSETMAKWEMLGNSLIPAIPCAFAKVIKFLWYNKSHPNSYGY